MKLSQMTTDHVADALVLLAPEIGALVNDETLMEKLTNSPKTNDPDKAVRMGATTVLDIAAHLLGNHRNAAWRILGVLNNKTPDEIGAQPITDTISQLTEALSDEELRGFFTPSKPSAQGTPSESSPE